MKTASRMAIALLVLVWVAVPLAAQSPPPALVAEQKAAPSPQQILAREMMESALLQARGLEEPGMRANTLLQVAQVYLSIERETAREVLLDAFQATLALESDPEMRLLLQGWILERLLPFGDDLVGELLPQAEPMARRQALSHLVVSAAQEKKFDRALELLDLADPDSELPYDAITQLMMHLPEERSAERQQLFSQALTRYAAQKPERAFRMGDMAGLVARFWPLLPAATALQAIDLVLERARRADAEPMQMTISTPQGAASFGSQYEFRLFQMLPALRQLDSSRAERLLRDHRQLAATLEQYPQGLRSLDPMFRETPPQPGESSSMNISVRGSGGGGQGTGAAEDRMRAEWEQRARRVVEQAEQDPKQALAAAMTLPESIGPASPRAQALLDIARVAVHKQESIAREALRELAPLIAALHDPQQAQFLTAAGRLYLRMKDDEGVQNLLKQGMRLARARLAQDADSDNPNLAPKSNWPSTGMYRQFLTLAADVSPRLALELLAEIDDEEVQLTQRVALAAAWLGASPGTVVTMDRRKGGGSSVWLSDPGREQRQAERRP
jgi:hypothetical protein